MISAPSHTPFGLSLSKAFLSRPDPGEREGFDKPSPNGARVTGGGR
jgi:hypothetical protein